MADTSIEWTDAVWNPVRGCGMVSPGCLNCYAMKFAHRFSGPGKPYEGLTKLGPHGPVWTGKVTLHPERLHDPFKWRKPRRVFVNSMSDLFHADVPDSFIDKVMDVILYNPRHTFQILTKRPERMRSYFDARKSAPDNAWIGTSIENQDRYDARLEPLLMSNARIAWISFEPLLGAIECVGGSEAIDWIVIGGESGPNARPCHVEWIRSLIDEWREAGAAIFVKQLGSRPRMNGKPLKLSDSKGGDMAEWPEDLRVREFPGTGG